MVAFYQQSNPTSMPEAQRNVHTEDERQWRGSSRSIPDSSNLPPTALVFWAWARLPVHSIPSFLPGGIGTLPAARPPLPLAIAKPRPFRVSPADQRELLKELGKLAAFSTGGTDHRQSDEFSHFAIQKKPYITLSEPRRRKSDLPSTTYERSIQWSEIRAPLPHTLPGPP